MTRALISLLACLVIASCGSSGGGVAGMAIGAARGLVGANPKPADLRKTLTPEVIASLPGSVMLIELPERGAQAGVLRVTQNGPNVTWAGQDGSTVAFNDGILTATRGLGSDLMSADLRDVVAAVYGNGTEAVRIHRHLDGEDQIYSRSFVCRYSAASGQRAKVLTGDFEATLVRENCASSDIEIDNLYWIDGSGVVRKSKQWVGPDAGYMLTELLKG
ncbi:YjbF family lipoprotein [Anianabacter salinae]|uniref:YjbF family lipoprotein n=1 Tax=Anianabacter salinae TaxID=2851023 RepID=UPI00225DFC37|nr:YjbF family lipoprotein [Anianabacter salinae]MBV0913459.1 YjbF family lipoprotein [Anianabacter salinae]